MCTYGRDETLLPAQRRFSLSQEKHLRAERATSDADYPGERGELLPGGGKFNAVGEGGGLSSSNSELLYSSCSIFTTSFSAHCAFGRKIIGLYLSFSFMKM